MTGMCVCAADQGPPSGRASALLVPKRGTPTVGVLGAPEHTRSRSGAVRAAGRLTLCLLLFAAAVLPATATHAQDITLTWTGRTDSGGYWLPWEGRSHDYTVKLTSLPSADVTVTIGEGAPCPHSGAWTVDTDLNASGDQNTLTFTTSNWSTAQTVRMTGQTDSDTTDDLCAIQHSGSGGGYDSVSKTKVVIVEEFDGEVTGNFLQQTINGPEGRKGEYEVWLTEEPTAAVTVTITYKSGDTDISVDTDPDTQGDQNTLTFTVANYSTLQKVTIRSKEDADAVRSKAVFTHTATGGGYTESTGVRVRDVPLWEVDDDDPPSKPPSLSATGGNASAALSWDAAQGAESLTYSKWQYRYKTTGGYGSWTDMTDSDKDTTSYTVTGLTNGTAHTFQVRAFNDVAGAASDEASATPKTPPGFSFSSSSVSVPEGGTQTYMVQLATEPTASVTVSVVREAGSGHDTDLTVSSGASLTFTTSNWNTDQTVTLAAAEDDDGDDGTATIAHTASGGDYASITGSVTATEDDNDAKGFTFSPMGVTVAEGSTATYKVKLATKPSGTVTVTVARSTAGTQDADLGVRTGASLTFTTADWSTDQTVTLEAKEDDDGDDGTADFSHTASGGGYGSVTGSLTATEDDNDTKGFTFSSSNVSVTEDATAAYEVKLATRPSGSVTVTVARSTAGTQDADLGVKTGGSLTFTTDNWNTDQTVTLEAKEDDDGEDGTADIAHTATGGGYGSVTGTVTATESDNDAKGFAFSSVNVSVTEGSSAAYQVKLATKPTASVTVTVARSATGAQDADLGVKTGGSLTFTADNWNTDQTVTLEAKEDDDGEDGTAAIAHTASGGGYDGVTGTVTATEDDSDTKGFTFSSSNVTVTEGATATYEVKLVTKPSASVTVTAARKATGNQDGDISVKTGGTLTFTAANWDTDQTVTLEAKEDDDGDDGTAAIAHTASGGGYGSVTGSVTATEADNDAKGFTFSSASISVGEGTTATYEVKLATKPTASVTVAVARSSTGTQDSDLSVKTGGSLTFTATDWDTDQTVTLEAKEDDDGEDGTAAIAHTASGGGYDSVTGSVTATEADNDTKGFTFSSSDVSVAEGSTATYEVKLATKPSASVTVTVARSTSGSHDSDLSVKSGGSLTFTTSNWDTDQTVTLEAKEDDDGDEGTADISHTASGGGYGSVTGTVTATEDDSDTKGFTFSSSDVSVAEGSTATYEVKLATKPSASVTVTVGRSTSGTHDADLSVKTGGSLTFTTSNWDTDQTVTLEAKEDDDGDEGTADISHTASGGGYGSVTGTVTATEDDSDTKGFTFSSSNVTVTEGSTATYEVKLATKPTASVTLTIARSTTGTQDSDLGVKTGGTLTFTAGNWSTDQTVTLEAKEDDDGEDGTAAIAHTASGGGYGSVTGTVTATEDDNDAKGLTFSSASVSVGEGSTAAYEVKLATKPTASVTVAVARSSTGTQDSDLSVKTGGSLTFTATNWDTDQTVTLEAKEDDDGEDGTAAIAHTASGGGYDSVTGSVTANEADNDTKGFTFSSSDVSVAEGSTATYEVKLATKPSASVTLTIARSTTGTQDADISVNTGGSLTFTAVNWDTDQTVTLEAKEDDDGDDGTADIAHSASGGGYGSITGTVTATEDDNDAKGLTFSSASVSVAEGSTATYEVKLATKPSASVTVTVARSTAGTQDSDLSVNAGASLTFTTDNWDTDQTVTIEAKEDDDGDDGTADIGHTATGGGYASVTGTVAATEDDNDSKGFTFSSANVSVTEGSTATYEVKLATKPSASVTVAVARSTTGTHDADLSVSAGASLTFTTDSWDTDQTVTLAAAEDEDGDDGDADIAHTASGGGYASVTGTVAATEDDNDAKGFTFSSASVSVAEGSTATYEVKLATKPSASVTVTVARSTSGTHDADLSVKTGGSLTFTTSNWNTDQTVTLEAKEDDDGDDGTADIAHTASGGGYASVSGTVAATEDDNDAKGFTFSSSDVSVAEGSTATYEVKLATKPSASVILTIARSTTGTQDADISVKTGGSLTFTAGNWNTDQTVTLEAKEDDDGDDGTADIAHTASGGGYGSVTSSVTATEDDNDAKGFSFSSSNVSVTEGSTATYQVKLATKPSASVTVTVARSATGTQDSDIGVKTGGSLTFTTTNWKTNQTVTLEAAEDEDGENGTAKIAHTASGGGYASVTGEVTATESDNDPKGFTFTPLQVTVAEGGEADYTVKLATKPTASVTVTAARKTGDDQDVDLSVKTGVSLTFTTGNWNTGQTVTLEAAEDDDGDAGTATIAHTASGGGYGSATGELTATESDDDPKGFTFTPESVTVPEDDDASYAVKLATEPSGSVTVTVARESGSDHDADLSVKAGAKLTFTAANWDTDQTVTLEAADDEDGDAGTADFEHTATGGGYGSVTGEVSATEGDDDPKGFTFAPESVTVAEDGEASYQAKLATKPSASVTVSVARNTGSDHDTDLSVKTGAKLTFTSANWDTSQTVTLQAAEDEDGDDGTADFEHTATGGGYGAATGTLAATEADSDTKGYTFGSTDVTVAEGGTASYDARLATKPSGNVTVSVERKSGSGHDAHLSVKTGASLTFTAANWATDQTVTLQAGEDDDAENGSADFEHTATGGGYGSVTGDVTATESDNDTRAIALSSPTGVSVGEGDTADYRARLATQPTASVTVTVAPSTTGTQDGDISVKTGASLTFSTSNWNTDQTVTLEAEEDLDGENGTATIGHTAAGGGYDSVTADLTATESDDDAKAITLSSPSGVTVGEGSTADYQVKLATKPTASVTVAVARSTTGDQDDDVSVKTGASLTFTVSNWNTDQTVTLEADEDQDGENGAATIAHTATGGGYGAVTADLTATESDNDTKGFALNPTKVTVGEGASADYTVRLSTEPSGSVTVTVARSTTGDKDDDIAVKTGASLTFTVSNWDTAQTVTLEASEDDDGEDGTATIEHTATGGGYASATADLTATEDDNDTKAITLSDSAVTVDEGSTQSYEVQLATEPTSSVTVAVARRATGDQDGDVSVKTGASLTFTVSNWNTDQTVTLEADDDLDGDHGTAVIEHTATGGGYGSVTADLTATEADDDTKGITLSPASGAVAEGSTATYKVKLATRPSAAVTVTVARSATGTQDEDISVKTGASLTFGTANWNTDQTVTLEADDDEDGENGTATIDHSAAGGGYGGIGAAFDATETDDDAKALVLSSPSGVTVDEDGTEDYTVKLATRPTASVTVAVARSTTGTQDADISVQTGASLTFSASNWNTAQTVTLAAADDEDGENGTATIEHAATGGGYAAVTADLTATETDDDTKALVLSSPSGVTVDEDGTEDYTVKLATRPTASVTVAVARSTTGTQDADISVQTGASLTFSASNWGTAQTVTLAAGDDADGENGTATIEHAATGGGYAAVTADLTATEADDDTKAFTLSSPSGVAVAEGSTENYQVKLATQPTSSVTVTVARSTTGTQDGDLSVQTGASLTFATDDWDTHQTVTLQAAQDDDGEPGTAVFEHTATGGGYAAVTAELTATEQEDDTKALVLSSPSGVTVGEGSTADYQAKLATQPTASVTVTVARSTTGPQDGDLSVQTGASLTFATDDWDTHQTVTLQAAQDDDGEPGTAVFEHTATGGGYAAVTAELTATEQEDDTKALVLSSPSGVTVGEGSTADYQVKLATQPTASVTVAVARSTTGIQDQSLSVQSGASLTFTVANWDTDQTVTIEAAEDDDGENGTATIEHTATGGGYGAATADLPAAESDNDAKGLTLNPAQVTVAEGATATYSVKLSTDPSASVTVTVARSTTGAQDGDVSVSSGASLTFSAANWDTDQTVTLAAADDEDGDDGTAVIEHTASGGGYDDVSATLTATEQDDDAKAIVLSSPSGLTIAEGSTADYGVKLATRPSASVTVTVARSIGGTQDADIGVQTGASLTFTTANWSTAQTVTLEAAADEDGDDGAAVIEHAASGGGYDAVSAELTATEQDDDAKAIVLSSPTGVTVGEGSTADYGVALATRPSASVTVAVARRGTGTQDGDLGVRSGASLTFTTANWATEQTVTLEAADDADGDPGTATFEHSASDGGYDAVTADLLATEADNDAKGLVLAPSNVAVPEGATAGYSVRLATRPSASVTVTVARSAGGAHDQDIAVQAGASLTYSTANWNAGQTVTLAAAEDDDGDAGAAAIEHSAVGGGYDGVTAELVATESDSDAKAIALSTPAGVTVAEGGTASYGVRLTTAPTASVTVTVARRATGNQDQDIAVQSGASLTFTTANWSTDQTVTLAAEEDHDGDAGRAVIEHSAAGGGYANVSAELAATESDNDAKGLTLSSTSLIVAEGQTAAYEVSLATQPSASVTVAVARRAAGTEDADIEIRTGASLTFTTANWRTGQTVTLAAAEDDDAEDGTATIDHSASGGGYDAETAEVAATESDNDARGLTLSATSVTVPEGRTATYQVRLATQPSASVTVTVERSAEGAQDADIGVLSGASLTFTTGNWDTDQAVTLLAAEDADGDDGAATFLLSASGGGYDAATAAVQATEADDDARELDLSPTAVTVAEGGTASYQVRLATAPSASVTVAIARSDAGTQDPDIGIASGATLTFATADWETAQTVTLAAAEDVDGDSGSAVFEHRASGGGYDGVTAELRATESDNDAPGLTLNPANVVVAEGSTATYTVRLATQPNATVTVAVARRAGSDQDADVSLASGAALTFTTDDWNVEQRVTVAAAEDADGANGSATLWHTASGGGYDGVTGEVNVTELDDETLAITLSAAALAVPEGGEASYGVRLATLPTGSVTVKVAQSADGARDADLAVTAGASLTFTTANWNTDQTVTIAAAEDPDGTIGTATFEHRAAGGGYDRVVAELVASELDNDGGIVLTATELVVDEGGEASYGVQLATQPGAAVTVAVARRHGRDQDDDLRVKAGASLTFTPAYWNVDQTVTIEAAEDDDGENGRAAFEHAVSGANYGASAVLAVAERDNDAKGLVFTPDSVLVAEGATTTYAVALATRPTADVAVAVASADEGAATASPAALAFTAANWNVPQTVTVTGVQEDEDTMDEAVTITHTPSGGGYEAGHRGAVIVAVQDDDVESGISVTDPSAEEPPDDGETVEETDEVVDATLHEGEDSTFEVRLASPPRGEVRVRVTSSHPEVAVAVPAMLIFTPDNWDVPQIITVKPVDDGDARDEEVTLAYEASGDGYRASATWRCKLIDDDRGLVLAPAELVLREAGGSASYGVALAAAPGGAVRVDVAVPPGLVAVPEAFEFDMANWDVPQAVSLSAADDADGLDAALVVGHRPSGDGYEDGHGAELQVTVIDDDRAVLLSQDALRVPEGASASYDVRLATQPAEPVDVALTVSGDADIAIESGSTLRFTTADWATPQSVTVAAAQDDDGVDGTAVALHQASGGGYDDASARLEVAEADDDTPGLAFEPERLAVREGESATYSVRLATQPAAAVSIEIASNDASVSASPVAFSFEAGVWPAAQQVTVTVAPGDGSGADRTTRLDHAVRGGEYDDVAGELALDIEGDRRPAFPAAARIADQRYAERQPIEPLTLPEASGGDGALTYALAPELPVGLRFDAATRVLHGTPRVSSPTTAFTYSATDEDGDGASLNFAITVLAAPAKDVIEDALAGQGRALLASATDVIGERFRGAPHVDCGEEDDDRHCAGVAAARLLEYAAAAAPGRCAFGDGSAMLGRQDHAALAGPVGGAAALCAPGTGDPTLAGAARGRAAFGAPGVGPLGMASAGDGRRHGLLGDGTFAVGLGGGDGTRRWTVWGAGDQQSIDGAPNGGSHEGEVRSLYLGVDGRFGERLLAGAALSRSRGETRFSVPGGDRGRLGTMLTAVYPYVRGTLASGLELWAIGGFGWGEAALARHWPTPAAGGSDLGMALAAFGARQAIVRWGGGELAAVGDAGFLSLATVDGDGFMDGLAAEVYRTRLALELSQRTGSASPYVQLGGRYDGGDGRTGLGVEVAAGVRAAMPRLDFEARGRWLTAASDERYEEFGAMARLELKSRLDGMGWHLALSPSWGDATSGTLLNPGAALGAGEDVWRIWRGAWGSADVPPLAIDAELGYAFRWPLVRGMLRPLLVYGRTDASRVVGAGVAYRFLPSPSGRDLSVDFAIAREQRRGLGAGHQALLTVTRPLPAGELAPRRPPRPPRTDVPVPPHAGVAASGLAAALEAVAVASPRPDTAHARRAEPPPAHAPTPPPVATVAAARPAPSPTPVPPATLPPTPTATLDESAPSLLDFPETHFAVQLMALGSGAAVDRFAAQHGLEGLLRASIARDGETLHLLILGVYADSAAAHRAARNLPPGMADITPWVRRMDSLQQAMLRWTGN